MMADVRDADGDLLQQFLVSQRINLVWESLGSSREEENYVDMGVGGNEASRAVGLDHGNVAYSLEANGHFVQQLPAYVERLASEGGRRVVIFLCDKTYNQPPSCMILDQILPGLLLRAQTEESRVIGNYVPAPGWEIVLHDAATISRLQTRVDAAAQAVTAAKAVYTAAEAADAEAEKVGVPESTKRAKQEVRLKERQLTDLKREMRGGPSLTAWHRFLKDGDTIVLSRQFPTTDGAIVVVVVPGDVPEARSDGVPRCPHATAAAAAVAAAASASASAAAAAESQAPCHWVSNFFSECGPDLMRTGYSGMCRHAVQICEDPNVAYLQLQPGSAGDDVMLIANADQLEASISIKELEVCSMTLKNQKSWTKNERTLLSFAEKRKNQSVTRMNEMVEHTIDQEEMDHISSLLDVYLTLDEDNIEKVEEKEEEEEINQPKQRIPYPETGLAGAATCVANLFSSLVDADATDLLEAHQIHSLQETKNIYKSLARSNAQLQAAYPAVKADVDRCMDLLMKIQMDKSIIEESIARSQKMLRESGHLQ